MKKISFASALLLMVLTAAFAVEKSKLAPVLHGGDPIPPCAPCGGGHNGK